MDSKDSLGWFRESPLGQLVRIIAGNKVLLYQEERPGFVLPWQHLPTEDQPQESSPVDEEKQDERNAGVEAQVPQSPRESVESRTDDEDLEKQETIDWQALSQTMTGRNGSIALSKSQTISRTNTRARESTLPWSVERIATEQQEEIERKQSMIIIPQKTAEGIILVDWYSTDDLENPQNWHFAKKAWVTWVLWVSNRPVQGFKCLSCVLTTALIELQAYTFVVYCASAIYTPSELGVMEEFHVGIPKAALGLSMYVLGYGFGE